MKRLIIAAVAIVAMSSCNKNQEQSSSDETLAVKFASAEIGTRTSGDSWEADDRVGISMYSSGDTESPLAENIEYSTDESGNFTEESVSIYYPASGDVDFYAYYPYQSAMVDDIYLADISDQSDLGAIDFMSASIEGSNKSSETQKFTFDHRMAMIKIDVTMKYSLLTLEGTTAEIEGLNTTASFSVLTGEMVDGSADTPIVISMVVVEDEPEADGSIQGFTATLMVLPETMGADVKLLFNLPNGESVSTSLSGEEFTSGMITSYEAAVGYDDITFGLSTLEPWSVEEESDELTSLETTL